MRRDGKLDEAELGWFKTFSCRDARCFKPSDRSTVLAEVRAGWGSEAAFDSFVRNELPFVLLRSKRQYRKQLRTVFFQQLELIFGD